MQLGIFAPLVVSQAIRQFYRRESSPHSVRRRVRVDELVVGVSLTHSARHARG
jgi:hypothetical protein